MNTFSSFFGAQSWLEIDPKKIQTGGLGVGLETGKSRFWDGLKYAFELQSSDPQKVSVLG